jgi:hypothetical protein
MSLPGNDLLTQVETAQDTPTLAVKLGQYIRRYLAPSIQTTASNAGVAPNGNIAAPAPPESVNVSTAGELMQVVVNHVAPVQKGARHIVHIATNPQFTGAMIKDEGASRSPSHYSLPTKDSSGATHQYYVGVVVQYPGSQPSKPTYFGGVTPAPITMGGTTQMDILPGTGSGTATNGGQALVGLGKAQVRL